MANEVVKAENKTFEMVLSDKIEELSPALPKDLNKARFIQNAMAVVMGNDEIRKYPQAQILAGLTRGAVLGLDFFNKECYLVGFGGQLNFMHDYRGAKKLAKKYAIRPIKDIYARIVRNGDDFSYGIEDGRQVLNFRPKAFNDGAIIGAFAVVEYEDGGMDVDTMSVKELENTRSSSIAKNSPAWNKFTSEMYRKTVLHRLCKHIEIDFENPTQKLYFDDEYSINAEDDSIASDVPDVFDDDEV